MLFGRHKTTMVTREEAIPDRAGRPYAVPATHAVLGTAIEPPYPDGLEVAVFGMGCFWGAERLFWQTEGVWSTAAGYAGGHTAHATYEEVCSGRTGHAEAVQVVFDPAKISYGELLKVFWESHDPTQGMRQGNDIGTQYRSAIYFTTDAQRQAAEETRAAFASRLRERGYGDITTEIVAAGPFYFAEDYHQQYLAKNPNGYRCHSATGVPFPAGV
ncbi:MAG TPA: peptide-methionine (S)-S-oxide reductase MsrA [Actinomycetes bacterium]